MNEDVDYIAFHCDYFISAHMNSLKQVCNEMTNCFGSVENREQVGEQGRGTCYLW